MREYRLTPKAEFDDMPDIWEYSFQKFGYDQANKYTDGLWAEFQNLADRSPTSGLNRNDIGKGYRSQFYGSQPFISRMLITVPKSFVFLANEWIQ